MHVIEGMLIILFIKLIACYKKLRWVSSPPMQSTRPPPFSPVKIEKCSARLRKEKGNLRARGRREAQRLSFPTTLSLSNQKSSTTLLGLRSISSRMISRPASKTTTMKSAECEDGINSFPGIASQAQSWSTSAVNNPLKRSICLA